MIRLKLQYFLDSLFKVTAHKGLNCPSCGSKRSKLVKRKFVVTSLRRCSVCKLLFRIPTTSETENQNFYQNAYQQGFTTEMPSNKELRLLKTTMFKDTEKDYSIYIEVLKALGLKRGDRLLDYGCSWGYGSWQFQQAGYSVQSYEISRARCDFARNNMGVDATWNIDALKGCFDVFFSAHVLEHLPSVKSVITFAKKILKPGGRFVAFTPNGSDIYRKNHPWEWQRSWGLVHPNLIDVEYYRSVFYNTSFLIASSPYNFNAIKEWAIDKNLGMKQKVLALTGNELLCAARSPYS